MAQLNRFAALSGALAALSMAAAPSAAADTPTGLTWQPPVGYQDFEPIRIPSEWRPMRRF